MTHVEFNNINISIRHSLANVTTIKTGGIADYFVMPRNLKELENVLEFARMKKLNVNIFGNGSNTIVSDDGLRGLTISYKNKDGIISIEKNIVNIDAGSMWPKISNQTADQGLRGLEFGCGIPGTIGGSIVMNSGIPHKNITDFLKYVKVIRIKDSKKFKIFKKDLNIGDRFTVLQEQKGLIIYEAKFCLYKDKPYLIRKDIDQYLKRRKEKQPINKLSAGCIFKREKNILPGKLIDEAGCKGMRVGGAKVSEKHANFIINIEEASSSDVWTLKEKVKEKVFIKFGIKLNNEVQFLGEFKDNGL